MNDFSSAFGNVNINARPANNAHIQADESILGGVTSGRPKQGQRIVIGGLEKVGKTSFACDAPRAMLVMLEVGGVVVSIPKTKLLTSFAQVMKLLAEIKEQAQRGVFQPMTIVWDTLTALERLIHEATIAADGKGKQSMETAHGGYGKAYAYANTLFDDFMRECDVLAQYAGINHIFTCHVFPAKQIDPAFGEYDQWDLQLHSPKNNKTYGKREMITQWADLIGFMHEPMFISKGEGEVLQRGQSKNVGRVLGVSRTPGYVAGNRYGLTGECPVLDPTRNKFGASWNVLAQAIWDSCGVDVFNRD